MRSAQPAQRNPSYRGYASACKFGQTLLLVSLPAFVRLRGRGERHALNLTPGRLTAVLCCTRLKDRRSDCKDGCSIRPRARPG